MKRILPIAALLLSGCGSSDGAGENAGGATPAASGALTVKALQIVSSPGQPGTQGARTLTGHFEIRPPHPNEQSIPDPDKGGACLVAQVPTTPKSCTADAQCNIPEGKPSMGPDAAAFYGYCLSGTCWVKANLAAGAKYCRKQVGEGSHAVPAFYPSEVYDYLGARAQGQAHPVKWKVVGCLGGQGQTGKPPPCGGGPGNVMHHEGNPRIVP
jgi:hypothetical protein